MTWYIDKDGKMKVNQVTEDIGIIRGYEPPMRLIVDRMRTEYEDGALKLVQSYFPSINKEELRKALEYDRDQYDKGYVDGATEFASRLKEWFVENSNYWFSASVNAEIDEVLSDMIGK